jgi:hypothetical protein
MGSKSEFFSSLLDNAPLFLDPDLVGLHLPEVVRLLDQVLLHRLTLDPRSSHPTRHRPFVEPKGDDDCLQRTAVGHERNTSVTVSAEVRRR